MSTQLQNDSLPSCTELLRAQVTTNQCSSRADLVLHAHCIRCVNTTKEETVFEILLEDLIGARALPRPELNSADQQKQTCRLILNDFPLIKTKKRSLRETVVDFCSEESYEENQRLALQWKDAVLTESERVARKTFLCAENSEGIPN